MARRLFGAQAAGRRLRGQTLTPPDDLPEAALMSAQERWWAMIVESIEHRAMNTPHSFASIQPASCLARYSFGGEGAPVGPVHCVPVPGQMAVSILPVPVPTPSILP